jgi:hypothetical protein
MIKYRLGRKAAKFDKRTLRLARYLAPNLKPPHSIAWQGKVQDWGMMKNDELGDCTCAAAGHCIMNWTANAGVLVRPSDESILTAYKAVGGYVPGDPSTDNGAIELDVLKYWQKVGVAGHKIGAYVSINPKNIQHMKVATWLFGAVYTGVMLTQADMDAIQSGNTTWNYTKGSSIGGHAIPAFGYNSKGFQYVTWGAVQTGTYEWTYNQMEEAYAIISTDWFNNQGNAPSGFNVKQLMLDLGAIQH